MNHSLPPVPSSPGSLDPSFRQGDNVCLATLASFTEKAILWGWLGGGGGPIAKATATEKRMQLPARPKNGDFCSAAGWEHVPASVQHKHHLKSDVGHLSKLQELLEEG